MLVYVAGKIKLHTLPQKSFKTFFKVENETWDGHIGVISMVIQRQILRKEMAKWPPISSPSKIQELWEIFINASQYSHQYGHH